MPLTMLKTCCLIHKTGMLVNSQLIEKNRLFVLHGPNGRRDISDWMSGNDHFIVNFI